MGDVFWIVGLVVLGLLVALFILIVTRPEDFRVERSAVVNAPAEVVFPLINDFHAWAQWSPFERQDPGIKKTFDGPAAGPGSIYAWEGNSLVGAGRTTILDSKAGEFVSIKLEMFRPFACVNQVRFTLVPCEGGVRVRWIMDGKLNFITKAFSLIMTMDSMVGKEFELGLANLNKVAQEAKAKAS